MTDTITAMGNDLKNYAYNIMKEHLINCTYAPGSILNEAHLTAGLKLSRTPVREAVSRLESEGFVKVIPKKGIYVTDILLSDVLQIYQIRMEFEPWLLHGFPRRKSNTSARDLNTVSRMRQSWTASSWIPLCICSS